MTYLHAKLGQFNGQDRNPLYVFICKVSKCIACVQSANGNQQYCCIHHSPNRYFLIFLIFCASYDFSLLSLPFICCRRQSKAFTMDEPTQSCRHCGRADCFYSSTQSWWTSRSQFSVQVRYENVNNSDADELQCGRGECFPIYRFSVFRGGHGGHRFVDKKVCKC